MSSLSAITVESVSKKYDLYDSPSDRLKEALHPLRKKYSRDFWALRNISFSVRKGEAVGIIGRNGSGKSTLLKIITGVLTPTSGRVRVQGNVLSLLELGAGFNPELSGLENIFFYGAILGYSGQYMQDKLEQILEFANIGEFVSQPVKNYSSGMYVRLAFSVIANMDADVLVIDEALAVGDELFQRKCFSRIESMMADGVTVLFVSHSGGIIIELCDRALLLDAGEKIAIGVPKAVVGSYQKLIYAPADRYDAVRREIVEQYAAGQDENFSNRSSSGGTKTEVEHLKPREGECDFYAPDLVPQSTLVYESDGAVIESPEITTLSGRRVNFVRRGGKYIYTYRVKFTEDAMYVRFGMMIKTISGFDIGGAVSTAESRKGIEFMASQTEYRVRFQFACNLNPGTYFLNAGVTGIKNGTEIYLGRILDACIFKVLPVKDNTSTSVVDFQCKFDGEIFS